MSYIRKTSFTET